MAQLPEQESPTVAERPLDAPQASPGAFGAGVGQGLEQLGSQAEQIAHKERLLAVQFDASDRELKYGEQLDGLVETYKQNQKNLQAGDNESYQKASIDLQSKFKKDLENLRSKQAGTLSDPLALRQFDVRTRLQTQAAMRHILVFGDAHIQQWREGTLKGLVEQHVNRAGNVTGDVNADLQNIAIQTGLAHDSLDKLSQLPAEEITAHKQDIDTKAVEKALTGYGDDHEAGLKLLEAKLPDGTNIAFDPKNPKTPYILSSAEAAKWQDRFTRTKHEKIGTELGAQIFFDRTPNPEAYIREQVKAGKVSAADGGKALQQFAALKGEENRVREIGDSNSFNSTFDTVIKKYGGDLATAKNDPDFLRSFNTLPGTVQAKIESATAKEERNTPKADLAYMHVIGQSAEPGWSERVDPAVFQATTRPAVGEKHWAEVLKLYQADQQRNKGNDTAMRAAGEDFDSALRVALDVKRDAAGSNQYPEEFKDGKRELFFWAKGQFQHYLSEHKEDTKTKGTSSYDPMWYKEGMQQILGSINGKSVLNAAKAGRYPTTPAFNQPRAAVDPNRIPKIFREVNGRDPNPNDPNDARILRAMAGG